MGKLRATKALTKKKKTQHGTERTELSPKGKRGQAAQCKDRKPHEKKKPTEAKILR